MFVYLIHFDRPLSHARHYLGVCRSIHRRLDRHARGHGSRIMRALTAEAIGWRLARLWVISPDEAEDRQDITLAHEVERHLKSAHQHSRVCPICSPDKPTPKWMPKWLLDYPLDILEGLTHVRSTSKSDMEA